MNSLRYQQLPAGFNKVPEVTAFFWIIKMMSTTVGETGADYLNADLGFGLSGTSIVTGVLLAMVLILQVRAKRHRPWLYWLAVVLISVFGTLITDNLSDNLSVPLAATTGLFGVALAITLALWYVKEKTLSIHAINNVRRELFYWLAILFTFALGTAAGDWTAESPKLGYSNAVLLFSSLISVIAVAHYAFKANAVACFWIAYVLTRPLGASFGDLLSQPSVNGGLDLGTIEISVFFLLTIVSLVIYSSITNKARS